MSFSSSPTIHGLHLWLITGNPLRGFCFYVPIVHGFAPMATYGLPLRGNLSLAPMGLSFNSRGFSPMVTHGLPLWGNLSLAPEGLSLNSHGCKPMETVVPYKLQTPTGLPYERANNASALATSAGVSTPIPKSCVLITFIRQPMSSARSCSSFSRFSSAQGGSATNLRR